MPLSQIRLQFAVKFSDTPGSQDYNFIHKPGSDFGWDWGPSFAPQGIYGGVRLHAYSRAQLTGMALQPTTRICRSKSPFQISTSTCTGLPDSCTPASSSPLNSMPGLLAYSWKSHETLQQLRHLQPLSPLPPILSPQGMLHRCHSWAAPPQQRLPHAVSAGQGAVLTCWRAWRSGRDLPQRVLGWQRRLAVFPGWPTDRADNSTPCVRTLNSCQRYAGAPADCAGDLNLSWCCVMEVQTEVCGELSMPWGVTACRLCMADVVMYVACMWLQCLCLQCTTPNRQDLRQASWHA